MALFTDDWIQIREMVLITVSDAPGQETRQDILLEAARRSGFSISQERFSVILDTLRDLGMVTYRDLPDENISVCRTQFGEDVAQKRIDVRAFKRLEKVIQGHLKSVAEKN